MLTPLPTPPYKTCRAREAEDDAMQQEGTSHVPIRRECVVTGHGRDIHGDMGVLALLTIQCHHQASCVDLPLECPRDEDVKCLRKGV